ncbi:MAG: outer membrane beta-barrel protein, partial [Bacteroidia bacterium]
MTRPLYFILLLMSITIISKAQSIRGTVTDSALSPVPFATIGVLNATDSSIIRGSLTDENGNFIIQPISKGLYLIQIKAIGFNTKYSDPIQIDSASSVDLPPITLNSRGINLNEISVSAIKKTIEFKNGNIIVNVEDSPLARGNTVYDLFSKLPGVSINDNVIQLNGKSGVIIMVDGRVQQLTNTQLINMLKNMNAELVEKIELLKNPPVKYDASGTSGMINIKTKKVKLDGFSGSVYTSLSQGFLGRSLSGISLNYKTKKITFFSNLDYSYGYYRSMERFNKKFTTDSSVTEFNSINTIKDLDNSINYKVGADWFINKKNIIGFKIDGGPGSYSSSGNGTNTISQYNNLGFDHLNALAYIPDKWTSNNYNVNAEHHFDTTGTVLNFSSDYMRLSETYSSNVQNLFLDANDHEILPPNIYRNDNLNILDLLASKLDFTKIVNSASSFEAGAKATFVNISNNYLFERKDNFNGNYYQDTSLTNNYKYIEQTYAAYFNYIRSFKKVNMQIGIRGENTHTIGKNTEKRFELVRNYYNLFPNISIEYTSSKNNKFQLNLNRRIDRPQYNELSPFRSYRDQYSYSEGNPFLQPQYSNTIELTHSYKQLVTNVFTYTRIDHVMVNYTIQTDSTKVTTETTKNMKYNNYYAYSFFIQKSLKPWWDISLNSIFSYSEYIGDVNNVAFKTAAYSYAPSLN